MGKSKSPVYYDSSLSDTAMLMESYFCILQKPTALYNYWNPLGYSLLRSDKHFLFHRNDFNRTPAVPGSCCGKPLYFVIEHLECCVH